MTLGEIIFWALVGDLLLFGLLLAIVVCLEADKLWRAIQKRRLAKVASDAITRSLANGTVSVNELRQRRENEGW